jgi:serine/threonine protein kinase
MRIVHGDLNSENILIDAKLDVKLIDFDNSSIEGSNVVAGGHPDFVT